MDLRQLHYFVRIAELKSLTRASEQLRIAQPALGFQLRKLEDELDTQLFVRHSRGVEPTEPGLILLERARELLEHADLTKAAVRSLAGSPSGRARIGIAPGFGHEFVSQVALHCIDELPDISIALIEDHEHALVEALRADRIDLACVGSIDPNGFVTEPLFQHDLYFIQSPGVADRGAISFAEVASYPLILPSAQLGLRTRLETLANEAGLSLQTTCEVQSDALAIELVRRSIACSINTYTAVRRDIAEGTLAARRIVDPTISIGTSILHKEHRPLSRAASAVRSLMLDFVREEFPRMQGIWRPYGNSERIAHLQPKPSIAATPLTKAPRKEQRCA